MTNNAAPNGQSWWQRLSEGSKITLIAAVITGTLGIIGAIVGVLITNGHSNGPAPSPSASSPIAAPTEPTAVPSGAGGSSGGGSAVASGYTMAYHNKPLVIQTMQNGLCSTGEHVNINTPSVDPGGTSADSLQFISSDCVRHIYSVALENQASGAKPSAGAQGQDDPAGCISAIQSDPNPGTDTAGLGNSFCVEGSDNFIAYVKISSVNSHGDVTLQLDGWSTS